MVHWKGDNRLLVFFHEFQGFTSTEISIRDKLFRYFQTAYLLFYF